MLIRTRGVPMTAQCDAESKRASRVRSRSQRPEEQSMRPVHRPFRTKATDEASKPDCSFSNVAARTPAWQCAPDCGRTCRQRHASRSIVSILEALAATVARRLQRRACDRHQGGRALCPCKNFGWNQPGHARLAGNGSMSRFYPAEREVVKASKCEFPIGKRTRPPLHCTTSKGARPIDRPPGPSVRSPATGRSSERSRYSPDMHFGQSA